LPFVWSHLGQVKTNHLTGAQISSKKGKYPVLIFSHGYWQSNVFNQYLLENLASCGFIILSISHEYETVFTFYPGNKLKIFSKDNPEFKKRERENNNPGVSKIVKEFDETNDPKKKIECLTQLNNEIPGWYESNITWAEDIIFCLKQIEHFNDELLLNRIDTGNIGVLGFSFGSGASGLVAMKEKKVKACINIDAFQTVFDNSFQLLCPTLFIYSDEHPAANNYFSNLTNQPVYELLISGTKHSNFSDISLNAEFAGKTMGFLGDVDSQKSSKIFIENIVHFLIKSFNVSEVSSVHNPARVLQHYMQII
jgi:hypothetical protein